jgi:hypothetical protein
MLNVMENSDVVYVEFVWLHRTRYLFRFCATYNLNNLLTMWTISIIVDCGLLGCDAM